MPSILRLHNLTWTALAVLAVGCSSTVRAGGNGQSGGSTAGGTSAAGGSGGVNASGGSMSNPGGATNSGGVGASSQGAAGGWVGDGGASCTGPGTFEGGGSCYFRSTIDANSASNERDTWTGAQAACEAWEGNLATITSLAEIEMLMQSLPIESGEVWIGLHDRDTEGVYAWVSGEVSLFEYWHNDAPSGGDSNDCITMGGASQPVSNQGKWFERSCSGDRPYYCER